MKKILIIFLIVSAMNSFAQKKDVYYIKSSGDTVYCKDFDVSITSGLGSTKYKLTAIDFDKKKQKLEMTDLSKFQGYFEFTKRTSFLKKMFKNKETDNYSRGHGNIILTQFVVLLVKEINSKTPSPLRLIAEENGKKLLLFIEEKLQNGKHTVDYTYYLADGSKVTEIEKKNFKVLLSGIFSNQKEVISLLNDSKTDFNDIDGIIDIYYKSIDKKIIEKK